MIDRASQLRQADMGAANKPERRTGEQTVLREANNRVHGLCGRDPVDVAEFVCECGSRGCTALILVTLREYAEIRADPTLVIVAPDHLPAGHELVYRCPGYLVVHRSPIHQPQERQAREPAGGVEI